MFVKRTLYKLSNCEMVSMKRYMYVSIFAIGCVSIHSMLLDVLALYVGDLQVEVFPITGVPNRGGEDDALGRRP